MIFKQWKLVYIGASVKMLIATWNTPDLHEKNNLEVHDVEQYAQYNPLTTEYSELQPYENVMWRNEAYNNPMIWGSFNTEASTHQYNPPIPEHPELQQPYVNEVWGYDTYNNPMIWESYNTEIPTSRESEERMDQREIKTPDIERLITEMRQTEQNLSSGVQLSEAEYSRRIAEIIEEQETAELSRLVGNLEEMPIQESTEEYRPYDMPEQSHSLLVTQTIKDSPYEYSNSAFLYNFLYSPSSFITADAIRIRFSGLFLSFLSSEQVIRVLIVLLENKLGLSNEDQKEFIEIMFGHIDYSLDLVITKTQVVILVETIMRSGVPDYFEQVFLTWKMWYNFTIEEQEMMLKDAKREHKREILVMLYLFVINRDEANSQQCEIFKNAIKNQYKEIGVLKDGHTLTDVVIMMDNRNVEVLRIILNTFDTCLLDLPEVFKCINCKAVDTFRNFFKRHFFTHHQSTKLKVFKYKSHACYVFTKFTREFEQTTSLRKSNVVKTDSRLYFDLLHVKFEFANWIRVLNKNNYFASEIIAEEYKKEVMCAFAMIRQITQSNEYNSHMFFEFFNKVCFTKPIDKPYLILLFSLTNENILKDLGEAQEWGEYLQMRSSSTHRYRFIEDIFMNNANPSSKSYLKYNTKIHTIKFHETLAKLNAKGSIIMHREYYLYRRLLFHPQFEIFNGASIPGYIQGLNKIGRFNSKEQRDQIARDLIFSEYYHEAAMGLKEMPEEFGKEPKLIEFKKSMEREYEIYKSNGDIKKEREMFRRC